jgi:hypothetical protein
MRDFGCSFFEAAPPVRPFSRLSRSASSFQSSLLGFYQTLSAGYVIVNFGDRRLADFLDRF